MVVLLLRSIGTYATFLCQMWFQLLFFEKEKRKPTFWKWAILYFVLGLALSVGFSLMFYYGVSTRYNFVTYTIIEVLACTFVFVTYKERVLSKLISCFYSSFTIQVIRLITKLCFYPFEDMLDGVVFNILNTIVLHGLVLLVMFGLNQMVKRKRITFQFVKPWQAILFIIGGSICLLLTLFEEPLEKYNIVYYILFILCEIGCSLLILLSQLTFLLQISSEIERITIEHLLSEGQKQYQKLLEDIHIINIKAHDLKHVATTSDNQKKDLYQLATEYESFIATGNEVLDVVLTEKSLQCHLKNILFTCVANGKLLSFMSDDDICVLFGNALDNAIEYEEKVEEGKGFIDVKIVKNNGFICVHIENYCHEQPEIINGLPKTSKEDKLFHGFGMKSIKMIVEKYGGEFSYKYEDDMFQLNLIFIENA